MKLKITFDMDKLLLYFTFVEILILRWILIGQDTILLGTCILILGRLFIAKNCMSQRYKNTIYLFVVFLIYIFLSSFWRQEYSGIVFLNNLYYVLLPAVWIMYFGYLISSRRELIENCFESIKKILNIYYVINFVIILMQREETYFLMPVDRIENTYYKDHIAGLIGIEGTHRLALFTVFVILLNFRNIMRKIKMGILPVKSILLLVFIIVTAIYSSAINDNNMLFLLIPIFILLFYMFTPGDSRGKIFFISFLIVIMIGVLYFITQSTYIINILGSRIATVFKNIQVSLSGVNVTDERMVYLNYAMEYLHGYSLGVGFGTINMRYEPSIVALGYQFRNWGMSDIAPLIAMNGVVIYVIILVLYSNIILPDKLMKRERKYSVIIMFIFTYYHQVLTHSTMTILMCWIIALFALQSKGSSEQCNINNA